MVDPGSFEDSYGVSPAEWLGRPAKEVYARLREMDTLRVAATCRATLHDRALLLDVSLAYEESLREIAFECEVGSPDDCTAGWVRRSVERAIDRLLERQLEEERRRETFDPNDHRLVVELFELAPHQGRTASVRFHSLPVRVRRIFRVLVLEDRPLVDAVEMGLGGRSEILGAILTAFETVGATISPEHLSMELGGQG